MSEPQQIDKQALEWAQVIVGMGSEISPARVQKILAHAIREAVEAATLRERARCASVIRSFAMPDGAITEPPDVGQRINWYVEFFAEAIEKGEKQ